MTPPGNFEVWIGLAEVRQRPGAGMIMDRNDAIVNVLANASNEVVFRDAVRAALDRIGFDLVELEDSEPVRSRLKSYEISDDLMALAREVSATGEARLGQFHTWRSDDS